MLDITKMNALIFKILKYLLDRKTGIVKLIKDIQKQMLSY